jgi:protein-S-isoprenylcysteine O-methyltransferase Ste14
VSLIFWLYYERIMFAEEEFLRRKFGDAYVKWAANAPAFLPNFRRWRPAELEFSVRNVLKREYSGMMGVILTFVALGVSEHMVVEGRVALDPAWQVICLVGVVLYFVLRTLKRQTRLLEVEGR